MRRKTRYFRIQKTCCSAERCDMTCAGAYEIRDCDEEGNGNDLIEADRIETFGQL